MTTQLQVFYTGRVQGVGFRYSVKQIASGYDVTGWVCNLDDGRVEMCVAGEAEEAEAFLKGIADSHLAAHIKETERHPSPAAGTMRGFEIRH